MRLSLASVDLSQGSLINEIVDNAMMHQEEDIKRLFAGLPCFDALDDEVAEFLAGMVSGDPAEGDAPFEESLGDAKG